MQRAGWPSDHSGTGTQRTHSEPEMDTTFQAPPPLAASIYQRGTWSHSFSKRHHQLEPMVQTHEGHISPSSPRRKDWRTRFATPRAWDTVETKEEPRGQPLWWHWPSALPVYLDDPGCQLPNGAFGLRVLLATLWSFMG